MFLKYIVGICDCYRSILLVVSENYDTRAKQQVVLPTAPKAARGIDDYSDKIPNQPPYIAYLSNLPYDVDEDEIANFFCNLKVKHFNFSVN